VVAADGQVQSWMVEGGSPNALGAARAHQGRAAIGTVIQVDGYQAKDGTFRANGRDVTFADGRKLFLGASGTGAPEK